MRVTPQRATRAERCAPKGTWSATAIPVSTRRGTSTPSRYSERWADDVVVVRTRGKHVDEPEQLVLEVRGRERPVEEPLRPRTAAEVDAAASSGPGDAPAQPLELGL